MGVQTPGRLGTEAARTRGKKESEKEKPSKFRVSFALQHAFTAPTHTSKSNPV